MDKPDCLAAQSRGNGCLIVLVDSTSSADWQLLDEVIFAAFTHMGIPYRILDVGQERVSAGALEKSRGVVLAQAHLGSKLSASDGVIIRDAVRDGLGLVCFGGDIEAYGGALREVFGIATGCPKITRTRIKIHNSNHFITGTRERGEAIFFNKPVMMSRVDSPAYGSERHCLLRTDDNWPALIIRRYGQGRVVLWTLSPRVWSEEYLGHAMGLDDLFWKGIVWSARKPFIMKAMPPFVAYLEDDATSSYNHFRYLDVFNDHGYIPHVELFLDDVDKVMHDVAGEDSQRMKAKYDAGLAEFAAHAFTYNQHVYFDHESRRPWSDEVIAENFRKFDLKFKEWGISPSHFSNPHFGEVGENAVPYMLQRGIEFLGGWLPIGEAFFVDSSERWQLNFRPYGSGGFAFDRMPDYPDLFVAKAMIWPRRRETGAPMVASEFLWGNTIFWDESPENNIQAAAQQALAQMRLGLDSLFFGELMTHEERIAVLSMRELDEILTLIDRGLAKYSYMQRGYDYVAEYARSKVASWLTSVDVDAGGRVTCDLAGRTTLTTSLYLFYEVDGAIQHRFVDVPPFDGSLRVFG
jgi:hypothetical protein